MLNTLTELCLEGTSSTEAVNNTNRHDTPEIYHDAVIKNWCRRLCFCGSTNCVCVLVCVGADVSVVTQAPRCFVLCVYVEPWPGSRPSSPNPTTQTACL